MASGMPWTQGNSASVWRSRNFEPTLYDKSCTSRGIAHLDDIEVTTEFIYTSVRIYGRQRATRFEPSSPRLKAETIPTKTPRFIIFNLKCSKRILSTFFKY